LSSQASRYGIVLRYWLPCFFLYAACIWLLADERAHWLTGWLRCFPATWLHASGCGRMSWQLHGGVEDMHVSAKMPEDPAWK
jgi:hypothetical protein